MALVFPSEEALCAALRAGLVPPAVQRAAVRFRRTLEGELELEPTEPLAPGKKKGLETAGVVERPASGDTHEAPCWAAALQLTFLGDPDTVPPVVLFMVEDSQRLLPLCGELLRLGCDRQEVRMLGGGRAAVRVREAPFFVVAKASEPTEQLRVFAPTPTEGIWLQLGWHHPLTEALGRPEHGALLVHGDGTFEELPDGPFTPLDQLIVPVGLPPPRSHGADEQPPRLQVKLRLLDSSKADEVSLWVVRDGIAPVESLVRSAPEGTLDGILFAVAGPLVLLKVRAGREKSVAALPGDGFARVAELPNLFAPRGALLEPPLSRERLREWLAPDSESLVWLERAADGSVARQSIAERAFRPLSEWVDYVIDTSAPQLLAWVQSSTFDFKAWEGPGAAASAEARERAQTDEAQQLDDEPPRPRRSPARRATSKPEVPKAPAAAALTLQQPEVVQRPAAELEERLAAEEASFLALDAPADSPDRVNAWNRLGGLYAALQHHRESGLSFAHALWEVREADALVIARQWAQIAGSSLPALLEVTTPSEAQTRAVVAQLMVHALQKDASARARLQQAQAWLDRHDDNLDVRSLWLGRVALSMLAGGDALGLARARDRVLSRLRRGLSLERDVPRFVRSVGPGSSRDAARVGRVVEQLSQLLKAFEETPRKRAMLEAPWPLTRAYVRITFAWAFARLGATGRARELEAEATKALDLSLPVHANLVKWYRARIAQAAEGVAHEVPLPAEFTSSLAALDRDDRYKFDRVRQRLVILEPNEHLNPQWGFMRASGYAQGEELSSLREITDVTQLARAIEQRIGGTQDPQLDAAERARVADGLFDLLLLLPESVALPILNRLIASAQSLPARLKAAVLEDAVKVAGHFGQSQLVKQLVAAIGSLMAELAGQPQSVIDAGSDLGSAGPAQLLAMGVRTLRRLGLRDEANTMLSRASQAFKGDHRDHLMARVAVAGGFAYLGRTDLASPAIEEGLGHLARETSSLGWRSAFDVTQLARVIARALAMGPVDFALPGLRRLVAPLPWLTDILSVREYLCMSVVELADIIAVGHVGEDLTLSEVTRTFLEEDEYRVRRRIHREATS